MRKILLPIMAIAIGLSLTNCTSPGGSTGGGTVAGVYLSKDPVVDAEKLTVSVEATFNTLFTIEKDNHDLVVQYAPTVHQLVDDLRRRSIPLLESARRVTAAYKSNSTPANRASLMAIISTLQAALTEATSYKTQVLTLKG